MKFKGFSIFPHQYLWAQTSPETIWPLSSLPAPQRFRKGSEVAFAVNTRVPSSIISQNTNCHELPMYMGLRYRNQSSSAAAEINLL